MELKFVPINDIKPHPKNPRVHPDIAIAKLEQSIKEFGWTNPILVSKDGYILAGHARLKAAEKAGIQNKGGNGLCVGAIICKSKNKWYYDVGKQAAI